MLDFGYYNMDCMEGMKQFPDKYFELAIVDPPYGIGANKEKPHNGWVDWGIKEWDNKPPDNTWLPAEWQPPKLSRKAFLISLP